ncbi:Helicase conserved C-terminal domain-containing protein [bacterium A37T11]|nr:Helicase conserved C-terminal domain-containing protein [bacterium A37T11]
MDGSDFGDQPDIRQLIPLELAVNRGVFVFGPDLEHFAPVTLHLENEAFSIRSDGPGSPGLLNHTEAAVLSGLLRKPDYMLFFDDIKRLEKIRSAAAAYGLEDDPSLSSLFELTYHDGQVSVFPSRPGLLSTSGQQLQSLSQQLFSGTAITPQRRIGDNDERQRFLLIKHHKYDKHLIAELAEAPLTKQSALKNPVQNLLPDNFLLHAEHPDSLKFYSAVRYFQSRHDFKRSETDILALKALVSNPLGLPVYRHEESLGEKVTAASLRPVRLSLVEKPVQLQVTPAGNFLELSGILQLGNVALPLTELRICYTYFVEHEGTLYLLEHLPLIALIELLKNKKDNLLISRPHFRAFRRQILEKLEEMADVHYRHIQPATPVQLALEGFDQPPERLIYLSDFGSYVMLIPVMRYGEAEVPVLSKKQIHALDGEGNTFLVQRDKAAELQLVSLIVKQHPYFEEQLEYGHAFLDLHKKHFLNEEWFQPVFAEWLQQGLTVLGFDELEGNKLNPEPVNITVRVLSGINWFNAKINVRYGKKIAKLKDVFTALRNKSKYVQLGDGTLGILPAEWIEKFRKYFEAGEITDDDTLQIPKINFMTLQELFEEQSLDEPVRAELRGFREKLESFKQLASVPIPKGLLATLRPYQQEGLNWLNFLDDFNFGGCLADDMGLGKTIQVIAFLLGQRRKVKQNTNLVVVPATLIFNWQDELAKFAPSLRLYTLYGPERAKNTDNFHLYEIILTSYSSLLSDVNFIKSYTFNYIVLDESQQIKNPDSQRYKAVRLLQSRNKLLMSGTPMENNSYDLYSQFSFACPGLLGSKRYFRDIYAQPIDQFKNSKRAKELRQRLQPFILRRSKQEVARELPEKTEMVLYCPMESPQRALYDRYEEELRIYMEENLKDGTKKNPIYVLRGLTRLRQICDAPALLGDQGMEKIASSKLRMLLEEIGAKAGQHKILVFSQFVSMLELIKKALQQQGIRYAWLTGQSRDREQAVQQFQNDPQTRVFLISLKAGGTGLNLTEADYIYLVDPWWNPAVENQAIDRAHRIGQQKKVVAVRLICPDTVEEKMIPLQQSKRQLAQDLVRNDASFFSSLTREDLLQLLQ